MPLYQFRLEAQDGSGHFRRGTINAASPEDAAAFLASQEEKFVAFQLEPSRVKKLADKDGALPMPAPVDTDEAEKAAFRALSTRDRAHISLHHQSEPYALVSLEEIGNTDDTDDTDDDAGKEG